MSRTMKIKVFIRGLLTLFKGFCGYLRNCRILFHRIVGEVATRTVSYPCACVRVANAMQPAHASGKTFS